MQVSEFVNKTKQTTFLSNILQKFICTNLLTSITLQDFSKNMKMKFINTFLCWFCYCENLYFFMAFV